MARFTRANEQFLAGGISLTTNKLKLILVDINDAGPAAGAWVITNVDETINPTITTSAAHGLAVNDRIEVFNVAGSVEVNGVWRVASVPTTTTFTIALDPAPSTYTSGGFVANLETEFLSAFVPSGGRIGTSNTLTTVTVAKGVFDCADLTGGNKIVTSAGVDPVEAFVIVRAAALTTDADLADTAQRLVYLGTSSAPGAGGLPVAPTAGGVELVFNASGIFDIN